MSDWLLSTLWYGSFLAALVSLTAFVKPLRFLGLAPRWRAAALLIVAAVLVVANARWTPRSTIRDTATTELDANMPTYHFREVHSRTVDAPAQRVVDAIRHVTADEIELFSLFTAIRRFGRSGPESILNAPARQPILDVATRTGFILLADTGAEVVLGTIVAAPAGFRRAQPPDAQWFRQLSHPGVVKAAMNFLVQDESGTRTRLTTETRVVGTDDGAVRVFTPYWRTIFPGSAILRVTWLKAIARRAES